MPLMFTIAHLIWSHPVSNYVAQALVNLCTVLSIPYMSKSEFIKKCCGLNRT